MLVFFSFTSGCFIPSFSGFLTGGCVKSPGSTIRMLGFICAGEFGSSLKLMKWPICVAVKVLAGLLVHGKLLMVIFKKKTSFLERALNFKKHILRVDSYMVWKPCCMYLILVNRSCSVEEWGIYFYILLKRVFKCKAVLAHLVYDCILLDI